MSSWSTSSLANRGSSARGEATSAASSGVRAALARLMTMSGSVVTVSAGTPTLRDCLAMAPVCSENPATNTARSVPAGTVGTCLP